MKLNVIGSGSNEVTGSSYLLTGKNNSQVLVDLGMFQGDEKLELHNYDLLQFQPSALEAVFLTHAHLDHSGRLPLLVYGGFYGKIYMTKPTRELVEIILKDSARIASKDISREPLYTLDEVEKTLKLIKVVDYGEVIKTNSFSAVFWDAGHILGSSSIVVTDLTEEMNSKIAFSGDLGNTPQSIVKPTEYIDNADFVVMESTYGDSAHPNEDPEEIIKNEINEIEANPGVLLIPVFAIERTQEILHIIHHLKKDGKIRSETRVFLDSPMGIDATMPYMEFKEFQNDEIKSHTSIPFNFEGLEVTYDSRDSREISSTDDPKVIIAGSGMMSGGRIIHHALSYLSLASTRLLFVGYQAENTLGRKILEGSKNVSVDGVQVEVKAKIREIKILSSHADQPRLIKWLGHIKDTKKVFLTHGEKVQREILSEKIRESNPEIEVILPENGNSYEL